MTRRRCTIISRNRPPSARRIRPPFRHFTTTVISHRRRRLKFSGRIRLAKSNRSSSRWTTLYLTVGSDHTDRKAETQGIALFKQLCPKPLGRELWALDDVAGHWDQLKLRSFARKACGLPGWHPVRNAPTERSDRAPWICASGEFTRLTGSSYRCLPSASCTLSHPSRTFSVGGRLPKV